jgi:hypothetical protein
MRQHLVELQTQEGVGLFEFFQFFKGQMMKAAFGHGDDDTALAVSRRILQCSNDPGKKKKT